MRELVVVLCDVRSAYNVGSIFRTADGAGFSGVYLCGYTPTPHDGESVYTTAAHKMISKTALGAEKTVSWRQFPSVSDVLLCLKADGFSVVALEQCSRSVSFQSFSLPSSPVALLLGNEPLGLSEEVLLQCDAVVDIPMIGTKESLNVSVAFGVVAYDFRLRAISE
ncbi:MAG: TrmH family RNA methyltransferase [Candidatus Moranbacteria bacterium]|nr:TrmH family RNA methyltransferase [Candidatus Moranbacteria bacterium]